MRENRLEEVVERMTRTKRLIAGVFVGAVLALLPATAASAHATLDRTSPGSGTVVQREPSEVVLTFSEHIRAVPEKTRITGPDGKRAGTGQAFAQNHDLH